MAPANQDDRTAAVLLRRKSQNAFLPDLVVTSGIANRDFGSFLSQRGAELRSLSSEAFKCEDVGDVSERGESP